MRKVLRATSSHEDIFEISTCKEKIGEQANKSSWLRARQINGWVKRNLSVKEIEQRHVAQVDESQTQIKRVQL